MGNLFYLLLFVSVSISVRAAGIQGDKPIHILTVGEQKFTNVVFEEVTDTHVFFKHVGGMSSARIADLDPQLQKQLGYDPVKGAALLKEQAETPAYVDGGSFSHGKAVAGGTNTTATDTNAFKPQYGTVTKDFPMGKTAKLTLTFPNRWLYDCQPSGDPAFPGALLRFGPQSGTNFVVLVSTLSPSNSLTQVGSLRLMNVVAADCAARSVDKPVVQRLTSAEISGNYFSIANKAYVNKEPKPGAYRFELQGMVTMDDFCLYFTVLYNYQDGGEDIETLEMIRSAHFSKEDGRR
jgi:hypothetical protein